MLLVLFSKSHVEITMYNNNKLERHMIRIQMFRDALFQ